MGQIPKNIIYAAAGSKLALKINGADQEIDEEAIDAAGHEVEKQMISSGQLKEQDIPLFREAYTKWKDQAKRGKYHIDTMGKEGIASIKYEGVADEEGLGIGGDRSGIAKAFTRRVGTRKGLGDIMSQINTQLGTKIGAIALGNQEIAEKDRLAAEAKAKTDKEATEAAEKAKWGQHQKYEDWLGKTQFAGKTKDEYGSQFTAMTPDERRQMSIGYFKDIVENRGKYQSLKDFDWSWADKYKTGDQYNFSNEFLGDLAKRFVPEYDIFGEQTSEEGGPLTPDQQIENSAKWSAWTGSKGVKQINENEYREGLPSYKIKIDPTKELEVKRQLVKDPATGKITERYIGIVPGSIGPASSPNPNTSLAAYSPIQQQSITGPTDWSEFERKIINGKTYLVDKKTGKSYLSEELNTPVESEKDGGVLKFQEGGDLDYMLKRAEYHNKILSQAKESTTPTQTQTSTPTKSKAEQAVESTKGKTLPKKSEIKVGDPASAKKFKDMGGDWSESDIADAGALALDLGGLVAGLVPGGSIVAGVSGLGSTAATTYSTFKRKGSLDAGDVGSALLSGALDVATLIPYVGEAAKTAKLAKHIPKIGRLLTLAGSAGLGTEAYNLGSDLLSGERGISDLTTEDLRMVVNGLRLISSGKTMTGAVKVEAPTTFKGKVVKNGKGIDSEIKFDPTTKKYIAVGENAGETVGTYRPYGIGKKRPIGWEKQAVITPKEEASDFTSDGMLKPWYQSNRGVERRNLLRDRLNTTVESQVKAEADRAQNAVDNYRKTIPAVKPPVVTNSTEVVKPSLLPAVTDKKGVIVEGASSNKYPSNAERKAIFKENRAKEWAARVINPSGVKALPPRGHSMRGEIVPGTSKTEGTNTEKMIKDFLSKKSTPKVETPKAKGRSAKPKSVLKGPDSEAKQGTLKFKNSKVSKKLFGGILKGQVGLQVPKPELVIPRPIIQTPVTAGRRLLASPKPELIISKPKFLSPTTIGQKQQAEQGATHNTIFDNTKLNLTNKQALTASEVIRTMLANKANRNVDTRVERPMVTAPAETYVPVKGDYVTSALAKQKADELRNTTRANTTSDAGLNFARQLEAEKAAAGIEQQGDLADLQARKQAEGMSLEAGARAKAERADAAMKNVVTGAEATQAEREAKNAVNLRNWGNWDAFLSSQNLEKKADLQQKSGIQYKITLDQLEKKLNAQHGNISQQYLTALQTGTGVVSPELQKRYDKYMEEYSNAANQLMLKSYKSGGGITQKDLWKEGIASDREKTRIGNRWLDKKEARSEKKADAAQKRIEQLINKALKP